jgi:hypothetical protein
MLLRFQYIPALTLSPPLYLAISRTPFPVSVFGASFLFLQTTLGEGRRADNWRKYLVSVEIFPTRGREMA